LRREGAIARQRRLRLAGFAEVTVGSGQEGLGRQGVDLLGELLQNRDCFPEAPLLEPGPADEADCVVASVPTGPTEARSRGRP